MGDGANVKSEAIADFEMALGRFAEALMEKAKAVEIKIRWTVLQLEERRIALRRKLERLQDEIDSADDDEDTSYARRQYEETEDALSNVFRWQRNVHESTSTYLREAAKLQDLSTETTAETRAYLRSVLDNLAAYFALKPSAEALGSTHGANTEVRAKQSDNGQVRAVAYFLKSLAMLQPVAWNRLQNQNARLEALQQAENGIADVVGRPALQVMPAPLNPGEFGQCDGEVIWINDNYLEQGFGLEMIRTIVHEGRHAYQYYVCDNPGVHEDQSEVEVWRLNLYENYVTWNENPDRYISQPVEADAFIYEDGVMEQYLNEGGASGNQLQHERAS